MRDAETAIKLTKLNRGKPWLTIVKNTTPTIRSWHEILQNKKDDAQEDS